MQKITPYYIDENLISIFQFQYTLGIFNKYCGFLEYIWIGFQLFVTIFISYKVYSYDLDNSPEFIRLREKKTKIMINKFIILTFFIIIIRIILFVIINFCFPYIKFHFETFFLNIIIYLLLTIIVGIIYLFYRIKRRG